MIPPRATLVAALAACLGAAACGSSTPSPEPSQGTVRTVDLRDADGGSVGTASLTSVTVTPFSAAPAEASPSEGPATGSEGPATSGVRFHVVITGLAPGSHGFHIHGVGDCTPPRFESAGPHFNPFKRHHGLASSRGPHAGDLPNLPVGADGRATVDFVNNLVTLDPDHDNSLTGPSGTSLVIHAGVDDEVSDPAGNSGGRIACGVISPGTATPSAEAAPETSSPSPTATGRAATRGTPTPTTSASTASPTPSFGHGTGLEGAGTPLPSP